MIYGQPITFGGKTTVLPIGYTFVEYIESSGTQYIDTGYKFKSEKVRVVLDLVNTNTGSSIALCGSENGSASGINGAASCILYSSGSSTKEKFSIEHGNGATGMSLTIPVDTRCVVDVTADNGKLTAVLNDTSYTGTYAGYTEKLYSFALFADNNSGEAILHSKYRLYSCKIYDNGTLVRDFVPCCNSEGVAGLYDFKNKAFYTNAGSGEFKTPANGSEPVLLWTNASPASDFGAQTVTLPTGYSAFLVEYAYKSSDSGNRGKTFLPFSSSTQNSACGCAYSAEDLYFCGRVVLSCADGAIAFGRGFQLYYTSTNAKGASYGENNGIPIRIWGVKFTL